MDLAARFGGVVINADALQVYSCWRILTARPTPEDEAKVPHRLYGHVVHDRRYSVGDWLVDIEKSLVGLHGKRPVIVGGTGLYFEALVHGLAPIPPISAQVSDQFEELSRKYGVQFFVSDLQTRDPDSCATLDLDNPVRVRRAWEVLQSSGRGISSWRKEPVRPLVNLDAAAAIVLTCDPQVLANRIVSRVHRMLRHGVLDECKSMDNRWNPALPSCQAHGARQFMAYLHGRCSLDQALCETATITRQYAKRQRSWHRTRMRNWHWVEVNL